MAFVKFVHKIRRPGRIGEPTAYFAKNGKTHKITFTSSAVSQLDLNSGRRFDLMTEAETGRIALMPNPGGKYTVRAFTPGRSLRPMGALACTGLDKLGYKPKTHFTIHQEDGLIILTPEPTNETD